jgi:hypothetical protein
MGPLPAVDVNHLPQTMPESAVKDLLEWEHDSTTVEVMKTVLSREKAVGRFLKAAPHTPAMQDDRPINEYFLLRTVRKHLSL